MCDQPKNIFGPRYRRNGSVELLRENGRNDGVSIDYDARQTLHRREADAELHGPNLGASICEVSESGLRYPLNLGLS